MTLPADTDWNEAWKRQMLANRGARGGRDCVDFWKSEKDADRFDARARKYNWREGRKILKGIELAPGWDVLDIGAGTGTLAIPLAERVRHVTAVEPSPAMMSRLKKHLSERGPYNVRCVAKRWEDVTPGRDLDPPYDVVIASFSLGMMDIRAALTKMDEASSKHVYIYWFAGTPFWEKNYAALWKDLHGCPYPGRPQIDCIYNVLYGMGIHPCVSVYRNESVYSYPSLDAAVDDLKDGYQVRDKEQEKLLRKYILKTFREEGKRLVLRGVSDYAKLWWSKKPANSR